MAKRKKSAAKRKNKKSLKEKLLNSLKSLDALRTALKKLAKKSK